jgi:hypothetical protein
LASIPQSSCIFICSGFSQVISCKKTFIFIFKQVELWLNYG